MFYTLSRDLECFIPLVEIWIILSAMFVYSSFKKMYKEKLEMLRVGGLTVYGGGRFWGTPPSLDVHLTYIILGKGLHSILFKNKNGYTREPSGM